MVGRGPVQITHRDNYVKFEKRLGVPLTKQPALALDPQIGADIAVIGMRDGMFRGIKLADFAFPDAVKAPPKNNPRRIVNGNDGSDAEVATSYRVFRDALRTAGFGASADVPAAPPPEPVEPPKPIPVPTPAPRPQTPPAATPEAKRPDPAASRPMSALALIIAMLGVALAYLANLPCDWLGIFCGG